MFIWLTAFLVCFLLHFFYFNFFAGFFVRCGDHDLFYNLFNVTLKNLGMFNVNLFCHLHSFFARCFYPIVKFFVLRKQKQNKLPTTKKNTAKNYKRCQLMCFLLYLKFSLSAFILYYILPFFKNSSYFFIASLLVMSVNPCHSPRLYHSF